MKDENQSSLWGKKRTQRDYNMGFKLAVISFIRPFKRWRLGSEKVTLANLFGGPVLTRKGKDGLLPSNLSDLSLRSISTSFGIPDSKPIVTKIHNAYRYRKTYKEY